MIPDFSTILLFLSAAFLLTVAPGPDIVYVAMRGLAQGPRAGLVAALGLVSGIFVHITLAALGLSAILASSPLLFGIIKYAGAAYIIYIGWQIAKSGPVQMSGDTAQPPLGRIYRQTILMNILNPKVALFFLAFLPQFVDTDAGHTTSQFVFFGVLFQLTALFVMGSVGLFAGFITTFLSHSKSGGAWMTRAAGSTVMLLGAIIPAKDLWDLLREGA
ncbi:LysE family translocator [Sneathiella chinensis]|uniref:LysE type translocator n=1 Tax=Sneathiella chinensis TaxID=349750 RepID=A0ABQ5U6W0_9PROT|nr:LysE family translocator [Sneathiella chinensis]GLQ07628.1 LysE type translocator [Sneathiella chinensis]